MRDPIRLSLLDYTVLLLVLATCGQTAAAQSRPNILFIYTDDQSHRTVGAYSEAYPWVRTPNIDARSFGKVSSRYDQGTQTDASRFRRHHARSRQY